MMKNVKWRHRFLHEVDLPKKAQKVAYLLGVDLDGVTMIHLEADPDGKFIKRFRDAGMRGSCDSITRVIYILNKVEVATTIHELTHIYINDNDVDCKAIACVFRHIRTGIPEMTRTAFRRYPDTNPILCGQQSGGIRTPAASSSNNICDRVLTRA